MQQEEAGRALRGDAHLRSGVPLGSPCFIFSLQLDFTSQMSPDHHTRPLQATAGLLPASASGNEDLACPWGGKEP